MSKKGKIIFPFAKILFTFLIAILDLQYYNTIRKQMPVMSAEFEVELGQRVKGLSGHLRSSAYSTARKSMTKDSNWLNRLSLY